jgi:putative chitinase
VVGALDCANTDHAVRLCSGNAVLETDRTMMPIHEYGNTAYFKRMYDINGARPAKARELGNVHPGDGAKFPGMGLVQSTGRANALRATKRMRELGLIDHTVDFEQTPELLMMPKYAVPILFIGMEEGWFTGVTLDKTIDTVVDGDEFADFVQARRIINGQDRADKIAVAAVHFLQALQKSVQVV